MATRRNTATQTIRAPLGHLGGKSYETVYTGVLTGSNSTEVLLLAPAESVTISSIKLTNMAKITGDTENYGTLTCYNRGSAAAGTTSVAARSSNSTTANDILAKIPWALTNSGTAADLVIDSGEVLTALWSEAGTGQDTTDSSITVEYSRASNTEVPVWRAPYRCKVTSVKLVNMADITGNASNYGTMAVVNRGTSGSGTTSVASRATDTATTDDVTAKVPWTVTLSTTPANTYLEAGEQLTATWTQTGSGTDLTEASLEIEVVPTTGMEV